MAGRSVDVSLRIKAQDEASNALAAISKTLGTFAEAQRAISSGSADVGKKLEDAFKGIAGLEAPLKALEGISDRLTTSLAAQSEKLAAATASIDTRKRKLEELRATEERYQRQLSKDFVGPHQEDVSKTSLRSVRSQITSQTNGLGKDEAQQARLLESVRLTREAVINTKDSQGQLLRAIDTSVAGYDRLAASAKRAADAAAQQVAAQRAATERASTVDRVNQVTGVNNTPLPTPLRSQREAELSATFAPIFAADDAKAQAAALRDAAAAHKAFEDRVKEGAASMQREAEAMKSIQQYARDVAEALDPAARATRLIAEEQARLDQAVSAGVLSRDQAAASIERYKKQVTGLALEEQKESRQNEALANYVQELRREYDQNAYAADFLRRSEEKLNKARAEGIIKSDQELAAAKRVAKARAEQLSSQGAPKLFGLSPYATQNLLFQGNDIATQLASGTSITQTLAQQGGQILQLFPKVGNAIAEALANPVTLAGVAALAATIGTLVVGIKSAADAAEQFRSFNAFLGTIETESGVTAESLRSVVKELDRYGLSAEDAVNVGKRLTRDGFNADQISQFGRAAKDMSDVLGGDLKSNLDLLVNAYTGNYDALQKLMDSTDSFTVAQQAQIRALYQQGDAAGAVDKAFGILFPKLEKGAQDARGPWSEAWRNLSAAWSDLVEQMGNTVWAKAALDAINGIADALSWLSGKSDEARIAEERRQGTYANAPAQNPLGPGFSQEAAVAANGLQDHASTNAAPGKTDRQDAPTAQQQDTAARLTKEAERAAIMAREIKSQADIDAKLAALKEQYILELGKTVGPLDRDRIIDERLRSEKDKYAKQLEQYTKSQKAEQDRKFKEEQTYQFQAAAMLRDIEKFRSNAYPDYTYRNGVKVNSGYRVGYGSDTVTGANGVPVKVTPTTTVSREDAERDLARRIEEFANVVKSQIGSDRFGKFSGAQQGALVSIAYNYGKLPERIVGALRTGTTDEIATAIKGLRNDNNGINAGRRDREAGTFAAGNLAVDQDSAKRAEDVARAQEKINTQIQQGNEDIDLRNKQLQIENGLQGEALVLAQRKAAIEKAGQDVRQKLEKFNADLKPGEKGFTPDQIEAEVKATEDLTAANFDLANARELAQAKTDDAMRRVNVLTEQRNAIQSQIEALRAVGRGEEANALQEKLVGINGQLQDAINSAIQFYETMDPSTKDALKLTQEQIDGIVAGLKTAQIQADNLSFSFGGVSLSVNDIANAFTSNAVSAIDQFAQSIAQGRNAFKSLWDAFRQFAADFLIQIAKMIQQQIIFNLVSGLLKSIGGAAGGAASGVGSSANGFGAVGGMMAHGGGVIGHSGTYGSGTGFRAISPAMFAGVMRYHVGGIAGLKPGEVPSILMKGEEVLTRNDPRHIMNGGGRGGTGDVKIINTFDEADVISKGLNSKAGERAIMNVVRSNPRAFKAAMGGG